MTANTDNVAFIDGKLYWTNKDGEFIAPALTALFKEAQSAPSYIIALTELPDKVYLSGNWLYTSKQEADDAFDALRAQSIERGVDTDDFDYWEDLYSMYEPVEYLARSCK